MKRALIITAAVGFVCVGSAWAQSAWYDVNLDQNHLGPAAGWFTVTASVSGGYGLASYKITMTGWDSLYQYSPLATLTDGMFGTQDIGFTTLRSSNDSTPMTGAQPTVLNDPSFLTYGIGQSATTLSVPGGWGITGTPTNNPFQTPVILLVGQYSSGTPTIDHSGTATRATVFTSENSADVTEVGVVPGVDAGGPYTIYEGDSLHLAASGDGGYDWYSDYAWDLDGDGYIETYPPDIRDPAMTVSYGYLESLGLGVGGPYEITVGRHVELTGFSFDTTTLTIIPEPASASLVLLLALILPKRGALALLRRRKR